MKTVVVFFFVLLGLAGESAACPAGAFSLGYCAAPVVAPVVSYAASVVAPIQTYAAPAQALVVPGTVTYTQPQVTLQLQQAVGYQYAAPVVLEQQQVYAAHQFSAGYSAPIVLQSRNSHRAVQTFAAPQAFAQKQVAGNGVAAVGVGPLGRVRSIVGQDGSVQQFGIGGRRR